MQVLVAVEAILQVGDTLAPTRHEQQRRHTTATQMTRLTGLRRAVDGCAQGQRTGLVQVQQAVDGCVQVQWNYLVRVQQKRCLAVLVRRPRR
jgi:3-phenylpropionate/cinnamic acid dioxygenase small subunit